MSASYRTQEKWAVLLDMQSMVLSELTWCILSYMDTPHQQQARQEEIASPLVNYAECSTWKVLATYVLLP